MSGQEPRDSSNSSLWVAVSSAELPAKKYFKIGEVAQLVGVEPHVLRYWQTQFPQVRPQKSRSGHRLYRRRDVETLLAIRELLHVQRFTIAGAKQALRTMGKNPSDLPVEVTTSDAEEMPTASMHSIDAFRAISENNHLFEVDSLEDEEDAPSVFAHNRSAVDGGMRDNIRPPVGTLPRP
jgi:DNA-binding transcriptional MerR regulator